MSADRGHLRTMRLLPFTAAAWVADPRYDRRQEPASRPVGRVLCRCVPDLGEWTRYNV
jgi:hypothetical protein